MKSAPANSGVFAASSSVRPALPTPKIFTTGLVAGSKREAGSGFCIAILSGALQQPAKRPLDSSRREKRTLVASAVFERAIFHETDGGGKFRLVQRGGQAADGAGVAKRDVHLKNIFREPNDPRHARAAAAEKNSGAQIIREAGLLQFPERRENSLEIVIAWNGKHAKPCPLPLPACDERSEIASNELRMSLRLTFEWLGPRTQIPANDRRIRLPAQIL